MSISPTDGMKNAENWAKQCPKFTLPIATLPI